MFSDELRLRLHHHDDPNTCPVVSSECTLSMCILTCDTFQSTSATNDIVKVLNVYQIDLNVVMLLNLTHTK